MSAGSLVGTIGVMVIFGVFWTVLGIAMDKLGTVFNRTINIVPTFQDAVTGFTMIQQVYLIIPVIVFIVLIVDHILTENSHSSGEV